MSTLSQFFDAAGMVEDGPPGNLRVFASTTPSTAPSTTIPANVEYIVYAVLGGGGGGSSAIKFQSAPISPASLPSAIAGGAGGGFSYNEGPVTGPFSASVTIGAGGVGATPSPNGSINSGSPGGTSFISGIPLGTISATGGGGGPGSGGSGSGGLFNSSGAPSSSAFDDGSRPGGGAGGKLGSSTGQGMTAGNIFNSNNDYIAQFNNLGQYSHVLTFFSPAASSFGQGSNGGGITFQSSVPTPPPGGRGAGGGGGRSTEPAPYIPSQPPASPGGSGGPGFAAIEFWNKV